jgi:hypothetical protein
LKKLGQFFPTLITPDEVDVYRHEVSKIQTDSDLPPAEEQEGQETVPVRLDHWWAKVFRTKRYPTLTKVVKACPSKFTGPHIERSFSYGLK